MKYNYPSDLLNSLYSFPKDVLEELFPVKIHKPLIKQLIEIAYHTSFLTEEERQIRFKIAVISQDRVGYNRRGTNQNLNIIEFSEDRDLSIVELMRLSPAIDFTSTLICVDSINYIPGKANQNLKIWGLISTGESIKKLLRLQTDQATHLPSCLVVSSMAPGHIQLSQNIKPLISLQNGKLSIVHRNSPTLPKAIINILETACRNIEPKNQESQNVFSELIFELKCKKYIEIFCKILIQLSDSCHGLTLLFIPHDSKDIDQLLSIKYKTVFQKIRYLFEDCFAELPSSDDSKNEQRTLSQLDNKVDEAIAMISRTSSVDGAIVINDCFEMIGFGAEITANNVRIDKLHFSIGQTGKKFSSRNLTDFGTRHRSAARFTKAHPGSIAFVISQDGERKIFTTEEEKVVVYSNIVWDKMWESVESIA